MDFLDEDVLEVIPLSVIPGDAPGPSSTAGNTKGNFSDNPPLNDKLTRVLDDNQFEYLRGKLGI